MEEKIVIQTQYMTLGQALKEAAVIDSGGQAKWFLAEIPVFINDEQEAESRRGRKLYPGDTVYIEDEPAFSITDEE
ncbi:S4 domain-containing protein YaaA [Salisediminibacterium halotolerans]|uniref:S4 domain-containing protein YaaA n=1 Tax=Salisediminibacterium halotolerans TaxID=517425 RepID=UPI000EADF9F0|nr:S4 domain-containing protein YaaA [Salisediminibacterium halotolerans]RLJ69740.1 S4 domain protein YaaA [Actinophytocola xinjiangensis]RPE89798.1 S4 domain protein YaaA [Salisediminibacterium halotolerans]TWG32634.1 S4 domain protein YaaA [Salisediminibacterium halotolerans]GEL07554.1 S4 domain protein YaaA [Salisediminibacterium halotolerans]